MDCNEYRELTSAIDAYLKTGNRQILASIRNCIKTKEECRQRLMEELVECNQRYIQVLSTDDQVKIVSSLVEQIKQKQYLAYRVTWMLPYVSNKALNHILINADNVALLKIMKKIEGHIKVIGNRFCDLSPSFCIHSTNVLSRMGEKMVWKKLYRKCKKNLK